MPSFHFKHCLDIVFIFSWGRKILYFCFCPWSIHYSEECHLRCECTGIFPDTVELLCDQRTCTVGVIVTVCFSGRLWSALMCNVSLEYLGWLLSWVYVTPPFFFIPTDTCDCLVNYCRGSLMFPLGFYICLLKVSRKLPRETNTKIQMVTCLMIKLIIMQEERQTLSHIQV